MLPAYVAHAVPGRTRIKIPAKRGDSLFFAKLESGLLRCPDVASVQTNYRAASILITFSAEGSLASVDHYARQHRLFNLENEPLPLKTVGELISDQVGQVNRLVGTGSRGHLDIQSIFFLLFLGLGLKQLWRGHIMQPAIPLLWRAMEILRDINENMERNKPL
jgi:hypothetical protein